MTTYYYAVVNDLIGGFDVSTLDVPTAEAPKEHLETAWGLTSENATMIADALNEIEAGIGN